jgi:hypothetical protein
MRYSRERLFDETEEIVRTIKTVALMVALFVMAVGVAAVFVPDALMNAATSLMTPGGLYGIAALRVVIGIVLIAAASRSRAPKVLRVFGAIAIIGGVFTPIFGLDRSRAALAWEAAQGVVFVRLGGAFALILGAFLAFAVTGRRTATS